MQRIYVDFNRSNGDTVQLLGLLSPQNAIIVQDGEHIVLYDDDGLEVEGIAHFGPNAIGIDYWYAVPLWETRRDVPIVR